jgi:methyl acetate hydrolase
MGSDFDARFHAAAVRHGIPAAVGMWGGEEGIRALACHGDVAADSIFAIASMTKAITAVAALQLVEHGALALDRPAGALLPDLRELPVLQGFDRAGAPRFGKRRYEVTLRQLLAHTAGFGYVWNHPLLRRYGQSGTPFLLHRPGTRWQYGTNIDHVGRLVEAASGQTLEAYFQERLLQPLGMRDTSFVLAPEKFPRLVSTWQRDAGGVLREQTRIQPPAPESFNGGGGLYSTAPDYFRFLQMILRGGAPMLGRTAFRELCRPQTGRLPAGPMRTTMPERAADVDFHPGYRDSYTLAFLRNNRAYPGGRSASSLAWAGIRNTFYWVDPKRGVAAVLLMQFQPFCDRAAMGMLRDFESEVYRSL